MAESKTETLTAGKKLKTAWDLVQELQQEQLLEKAVAKAAAEEFWGNKPEPQAPMAQVKLEKQAMDAYQSTKVWFMGYPVCRNPACEKSIRPSNNTFLVVDEHGYSAYCNISCMYAAINAWAHEEKEVEEELPTQGRRFVFRPE